MNKIPNLAQLFFGPGFLYQIGYLDIHRSGKYIENLGMWVFFGA